MRWGSLLPSGLFYFAATAVAMPLLLSGPGFSWRQATARVGDRTVYFHQKGSCVRWSLSTRGCEDVADLSILRDAVARSFDTWSSVDCSYMKFVEEGWTDKGCDSLGYVAGEPNVNLVVWCSDWSSLFDTEAVAITQVAYSEEDGAILDADIALNDDGYMFAVVGEGCMAATDIQNTITHEAGHMLGLDHSEVPGATMAPHTNFCDIEKRTLHDDDVAGLCALYPVSSCRRSEEAPNLCECVADGCGCKLAGGGGAESGLFLCLAAIATFLAALVMRARGRRLP